MEYIIGRLRNLNLPAAVTDDGLFMTDTGIILHTAVPGRGLLDLYRSRYSMGIEILVRELASAVHDEVEEIEISGVAGRHVMSDMLALMNLRQ